MEERFNKIINIEKDRLGNSRKLYSSFVFEKSGSNRLLEFSRNYTKYDEILTELADVKEFFIDPYGNKKHYFSNFQVEKPRFEILKLFKPGEILNSIVNNHNI
ncbi:MAG: hypothetical protein V2B14_05110 [bacterium]